jgi:hypothetical protein
VAERGIDLPRGHVYKASYYPPSLARFLRAKSMLHAACCAAGLENSEAGEKREWVWACADIRGPVRGVDMRWLGHGEQELLLVKVKAL